MPDIEQKKHVIRERARALIITFLLKKIPGQIIVELIWFVGLQINQEPSENGVSGVYSLQIITMVQDISYDKHYRFRLVFCVKFYEDRNIINNMEEQKVSGIFLGPTASFQGSYKKFP